MELNRQRRVNAMQWESSVIGTGGGHMTHITMIGANRVIIARNRRRNESQVSQ